VGVEEGVNREEASECGGFGDGGQQLVDVGGAELGIAEGEEPGAEARGLAEEGGVEEEVVGGGDLSVVVEVALLPVLPLGGVTFVEEGVVVGV
jgi:hypothetical protein